MPLTKWSAVQQAQLGRAAKPTHGLRLLPPARWWKLAAGARRRHRRAQRCRRLPAPQATVATGVLGVGRGSSPPGLLDAKQHLLSEVAGTQRGCEARGLQRGVVEEAQVAVETFASGAELDFGLLPGKWRLEYTTARDVLLLASTQRLPAAVQFGHIYQQFSSLEEGRAQSIIEAHLPPPPLPLVAAAGLGLAFVVEEGCEAHTARSITLTFREAGFRDVVASPALQNLLASPILPRGWWNLQLLQALKQLSLSVPLTTRLPGAANDQRQPVGLNYMLTYLDKDMLIGRAQGNGSTFIFSREQAGSGAGSSSGQ